MTLRNDGREMSPRHYRPSTKPLVTAWARHLDKVMRERDLSQTNVFEAVHAELGFGSKSRSALVRVFSDKQPSAEIAAALARHYGYPEPEPDPVPEQDASVAAAIDRQTAALVALLEAANRRAAIAEQRLDAIETVLLNMTNRPVVDPRDVAEAEAARERLVGSASSPRQPRLSDAGTGR